MEVYGDFFFEIYQYEAMSGVMIASKMSQRYALAQR